MCACGVVFLLRFLFPVCADNTIEPITAYEAELMSTIHSIRRAAGAGIRWPREEDPQAALDEEREMRTRPEMPARRIIRAQRQRQGPLLPLAQPRPLSSLQSE